MNINLKKEEVEVLSFSLKSLQDSLIIYLKNKTGEDNLIPLDEQTYGIIKIINNLQNKLEEKDEQFEMIVTDEEMEIIKNNLIK